MGLGENIVKRRKELNMSAKELAEKCGIKSAYMSQIENDKKTPILPLTQKIAEVLMTTTTKLLDEKVFIGSNLKLLRKNMTHKQFADYIKEVGGVYIDPEILENFETGKDKPYPKEVEFLAKTFSIPENWFCEENNDTTLKIASMKTQTLNHMDPEIKAWVMDPKNYKHIKFVYNYINSESNKKEP
jgi:transcriptional regulator with XRE-family HTH domain